MIINDMRPARLGLLSALVIAGALGFVCFITSSASAYADTPSSSCSSTAATDSSSDDQTPPATSDTDATCPTTSDSTDPTTDPVSPAPSQTDASTDSTTPTPSDTTNDSADPAPVVPSDTQDDSTQALTSTCGDDPSTSDASVTATIDSCVQAASTSGQATIDSHTGSNDTSTSGGADNALNEVNEVTDGSAPPTTTYTDDVYGDQTGDIEVDPTAIAANQTDNSVTNNIAPVASSDPSSTSSDNTINNTDSLVSRTGDANVTGDGSSNTATSGDAESLANIVNLIDSAITSKRSFEGVINIYGNLYGDILLPQDLIDQLVSPGATPSSLAADEYETDSINNNVEQVSASGNATVLGNGDDNTATSGNATTELSIANYINSLISANNLFLVIINVSGQWQGYLLGQVPESNISLLGGGVSNNYSTQPETDFTGVDSSTSIINNNIELAAYSGDASVIGNGNDNTAVSGDAESLANIANFEYDNFNLSGFFGILFINIFGNWYGSLSTYDTDSSPQVTPNTIIASPAVASTTSSGGDPAPVRWVFLAFTDYNSDPPAQPSNASLTSYTIHAKSSDITKTSGPSGSKAVSQTSDWLLLLAVLPILILPVVEDDILRTTINSSYAPESIRRICYAR